MHAVCRRNIRNFYFANPNPAHFDKVALRLIIQPQRTAIDLGQQLTAPATKYCCGMRLTGMASVDNPGSAGLLLSKSGVDSPSEQSSLLQFFKYSSSDLSRFFDITNYLGLIETIDAVAVNKLPRFSSKLEKCACPLRYICNDQEWQSQALPVTTVLIMRRPHCLPDGASLCARLFICSRLALTYRCHEGLRSSMTSE